MINWKEAPSTTARDMVRTYFESTITPDKYGFSDGQWNLTDIITSPNPYLKEIVESLFLGTDARGRIDPQLRPIDDSGLPYTFRLRVLTRQACERDADGKELTPVESRAQQESLELVSHNDKPKEGDAVRWKGDMRRSPIEPHLSTTTLEYWRVRGELPHYYYEYKIDKDGCILVPFAQARAMLAKKGERLVFPDHTRMEDGSKDKAARKISNWWFKEVPKNYKAEQPISTPDPKTKQR